MIDSRDYDTTEELEAAMRNEGNIAVLQSIKARISKYEYIKCQYDRALETLRTYQEIYEKRISEYYELERNKNKKKMEKIKKNDRKSVIFDDFEFYGRGGDIYNKSDTNEDSS